MQGMSYRPGSETCAVGIRRAGSGITGRSVMVVLPTLYEYDYQKRGVQ